MLGVITIGTYDATSASFFLGGRLKSRNCWERSANRSNGNNVAYVNANGNCTNNNAVNGNRGAADRTSMNAASLHEVGVAL